MLKKQFKILFTFCIFYSFSAIADVKIGFVEVQKILQEAPQTIEINKKLEKEFNARSDKLKTDIKALNDKQAAFNKDSMTMKDSDKETRAKSLDQLRIDIQRKDRELKEDFNIRKNEELAGLQEQINKAVTSVAKSEGYDLVVYNGVAYASEKIDITDKILKTLGKK